MNTMNQPDQTTHTSHAHSQNQTSHSSTSSSSMQHQVNTFNAQDNSSPTHLPSPSTHDSAQTQPYTENQSQTCQHQRQDREQHYRNPSTDPSQSSEPAYPHQIHGLGGPTATAPFLRDFSLVAEAARRAQVSVVTRDLEGISL